MPDSLTALLEQMNAEPVPDNGLFELPVKKKNQSATDYKQIVAWLPTGASVLDLGCGDGTLLQLLRSEKNIKGVGVERDAQKVQSCLASGLSVFQDTLEASLADYPDKHFDYVILNQTLQALANPVEVLKAMHRVGKRIVVGFPNFAHWEVRFKLLTTGRMPSSGALPYAWHNTPNIHLFSIKDFLALCQELKLQPRRSQFKLLGSYWSEKEPWPNAANWLATHALYELE
jgi:methionine biosynthesis protein MetW